MDKHKRIKPLLLKEFALMAFGNHLIKSLTIQTKIKPNKHMCTKTIKEYLSSLNTTPDIRQILLNLIAKAANSVVIPKVRNACFKILLDESITYFGADIYWDSYYKRVWKYMARQCKGLRTLNLTNAHIPENEMENFEIILRENKKLVHFCAPLTSLQGTIFEIVNKHCTQLKCFVFSENDNILTNAEFITTCSFTTSLTRIDLRIGKYLDSRNDPEAISMILQNCTNLESLTDAFVGLALVMCRNENQDFQCKLRKVCDCRTNKETMKTILDTCPKMEQLHLIKPNDDALLALEKQDLHELIAEYINLSYFVEVLRKVGDGLLSLILKESRTTINIGDLILYCPNLTKFVFESSSNLKTGEIRGVFQKLEELKIHESLVSAPIVRKLLCCTINLQIFNMDVSNFEDADMISILAKNSFEKLREFHIEDADFLTSQSVNLLVESCPNLDVISNLRYWCTDRANIPFFREVEGPDVQLTLPYLPEGFVLRKLYNYK